MDLTEEEVKETQQVAPAFSLEELTECARLCAQNELMQKNQGTPQLGLELVTLDCLELHRRAQSGQPVRVTNPVNPPQVAHQAQPVNYPAPNTLQPPALPGTPREPDFPSTLPKTPQEQTRRTEPLSKSEFTFAQINGQWESVKRRVHQRAPLLAAYLKNCEIARVDTMPEHHLVYVQTSTQRHFDNIKARTEDIEWGLGTEFDSLFKVKVLPPGQLPPQAANPPAASYSMTATAPQPSAYREPSPPERHPPVPPEYRAAPSYTSSANRATAPTSFAGESRGTTRSDQAPLPALRVSETPGEYKPEPLARSQPVSENKKKVLSREELEQKVHNDKVVQEFQRTFRASVQKIQPK
jgi:hypothetical protein